MKIYIAILSILYIATLVTFISAVCMIRSTTFSGIQKCYSIMVVVGTLTFLTSILILTLNPLELARKIVTISFIPLYGSLLPVFIAISNCRFIEKYTVRPDEYNEYINRYGDVVSGTNELSRKAIRYALVKFMDNDYRYVYGEFELGERVKVIGYADGGLLAEKLSTLKRKSNRSW